MSHHHGNTDTQGSGAGKGTGCKSLTAQGEGRAAKGKHGGDGERSVTTEWSLQIQMYIGKGSSWREAHTIALRGDGAIFLKKDYIGTSLVVQGLRISLSMQGAQVGSLVGELRPQMPWGK